MNCKQGDLAYILDGVNAGAVVVVEDICEGWSALEGVPVWNVHTTSPLHCTTIFGHAVYTAEMAVEDHRLRPISGIPVEDEVTEDLREPA